MRVLVIGRQGQLARSLQELVPRPAVELVAAGRPEADLLSPATLGQAIERAAPDVVVNAAAYTAVDAAEGDAETAFAVNCHGAAQLAAAAARHDLPIIHVSTDYVYDGNKAGPYVETDEVNPVNVYGRSKLAGELEVVRANPRHLILRTAWVHSPFGQNFVKTMLRLGAARPEIKVVDDQRGNPTYAPHLAEAILRVAEQVIGQPPSSGPWGVYHVVGSGETTWFGFARELFRRAGEHGLPIPALVPIATAEYPTPAARPANSRLDTSKLERIFGAALPSWSAGVAQCLDRLAGDEAGAARVQRHSTAGRILDAQGAGEGG